MQLDWVYFCGTTPDDATESVATHSSKLQPSIICMPQLQPWCSAALVPKFTTLTSGQPWDNDLASWFSVLHWPPTRASGGKRQKSRPPLSCIWMPPHLLLWVSCSCHYSACVPTSCIRYTVYNTLTTTSQGYFQNQLLSGDPTTHFKTFVFPTFTFNPFAFKPFFHPCRFLFKSFSELANSTKWSAYINSQGNLLSSKLLDSASITMIKSSGLMNSHLYWKILTSNSVDLHWRFCKH